MIHCEWCERYPSATIRVQFIRQNQTMVTLYACEPHRLEMSEQLARDCFYVEITTGPGST